MNFYGAFVNGLREILAHKMRSLLSMSGIILGVAALVAMVSVVQGMVGQFKGFIEMQGGIEKITIATESLPKEQEHLQDSAPGLRMVDVDAIRKLVPSVSHISPEISIRWTSISRNGKEFNARVTGTMSDWLVINKRSVQRGRFLADADELARAKVCVLGSLVAEEIFESNEDPIGKPVKIGGEWFTVVGILNTYSVGKGDGKKRGPGRWMNGGCYIPIHTAMTNYTSNDKLSSLYVRVSSVDQLEDTVSQLDRVLLQSHNGFQDFSISTNEEMLDEFKKTEQSFMISLGGVAFISLFIGGIGIMNVMLAAINERIREIGVRKAVGARGSDIFMQFLVETALVSSLGGLLGLLLSVGLVEGIGMVMAGGGGLPMSRGMVGMSVEPSVMIAGFIFSVGIGVISGIFPALRASRLNPIDALRYE